jgi:hypothetical protein
MVKADLKIDWATHEAAKYACVNWHYSGCIPKSKLSKVGVWENGKFIGVVIYGCGATPNLGKPYHLEQNECIELVRIALTNHITPVSRILALSNKWMHAANKGLRLIVSFADKSQGHHGGIYQACNWVYSGQGAPAKFYMINGKLTHPRTLGLAGLVQNIHGAKQRDRNATAVDVSGKYRYLMPLDKEMAEQIKPLAKPYPKREKQAMASFPEAQRQGSTDLHAPVLESSGEGFSPLLADVS